ncbi:hypothetical protein tb265_49530 [Gemmatimonadetes bacterium T265]|nr:hypothetical protein tb265_49530 [Gemmatimonadetes bacterium T265]
MGARLRRLSERIDREAARVYAHAGVRFEQRWMGVLHLLAERGGLSVRDLADALGISHPSVSQTRRSLQEAGLVAERADARDARRRVVHLTDAGTALIDQLRPIWAALVAAAEDVDREAADVITPLNRLDDALARRSLYDRAVEQLASRAAAVQASPAAHLPSRVSPNHARA